MESLRPKKRLDQVRDAIRVKPTLIGQKKLMSIGFDFISYSITSVILKR